MQRRNFTLLEVVCAMAIFATAVLVLIERRDYSLESSRYATDLLRAQEIVDEVMGYYYLHPFSTEAVPLEKDYKPFTVDVTVSKREKPQVVPSILRPPPKVDAAITSDPEEKDKRVILDINVKVSFGTLKKPRDPVFVHEVHTLMRHIEIVDEEEAKK